jgi:hypothetical protein
MWILVLAPLAFADVVDPGYIETCTPSVCSAPDKVFECSAWHGERDACVKTAPPGYTKSCQTRGASVWSEIWCGGPDAAPVTSALGGPSPAPSPKPEPAAVVAEKTSGGGGPCGTVPLAASSLLMGAGLLVLAGRRRS